MRLLSHYWPFQQAANAERPPLQRDRVTFLESGRNGEPQRLTKTTVPKGIRRTRRRRQRCDTAAVCHCTWNDHARIFFALPRQPSRSAHHRPEEVMPSDCGLAKSQADCPVNSRSPAGRCNVAHTIFFQQPAGSSVGNDQLAVDTGRRGRFAFTELESAKLQTPHTVRKPHT